AAPVLRPRGRTAEGMSELAFVSPGEARPDGGFTPHPASPLARALDRADGLGDLSLLGKVEVRGELDDLPPDVEVIRITPRRALVLCPLERCAELLESLSGLTVDMTAALAGIELQGDRLFCRLTDLDADALPAAGKVAGVPAIVTRRDGRY